VKPENTPAAQSETMETILLVDDEPVVLKLCGQILKLGGYTVREATGGEEALRLVDEDGTIKLALLDVMMPVMNGIELAKRIQGLYPDIRIVLMTGFGPREIAQVAGNNNPYRIIWKPFKAESLLREIANVLND
jgi:two-component system, cell cycle sensor histidine kinase and response regulator CckA